MSNTLTVIEWTLSKYVVDDVHQVMHEISARLSWTVRPGTPILRFVFGQKGQEYHDGQ